MARARASGEGERVTMARRAEWEKLLLSHTHPPPSPPDASDDETGVTDGRRSSFSYLRLPEQYLRLTVLKLDGSSFNVEVARMTSVLGLKMEIENIFNRFAEEGGYRVSWSHVWGHFCLCYNEHKLTDDVASLRTFGIRDGDQLRFVRHISPNQNLNRRRQKNQVANSEQQRMSSKSRQHTIKDVGHEQSSVHHQKDSRVAYGQVDHFFRGWNVGPRSPHKANSKGQVAKLCRNRKINWAVCY